MDNHKQMELKNIILLSSVILGAASQQPPADGPSDSDIEALQTAVNGGRQPVVAFDGRSFYIPAIPTTCQNGPYRLLKQDSGIYYWDPTSNSWLITSTCNGLRCKELECVPARVRAQTRYVFAIRLYPHIEILGFKTIRYDDHLECRCKQCHDLDYNNCTCKDSCPNHVSEVKVRDTYCQWREAVPKYSEAPKEIAIPASPYAKGYCFCCEVPLSCPRGKVFSRNDCVCKCPYVLSCSPKHYWNEQYCKCKCKIVYKCPFTQFWDETTCSCKDLEIQTIGIATTGPVPEAE